MSAEEDRLRLAEINEILSTGMTSESSDGQSVTLNFDALYRERRRLEIRLGLRRAKPLFRSYRLGAES